LLGEATGDPAYTTLGKLKDACMIAKKTDLDFEKSKANSEYDAYAKRLRRELVWQVSSSCIQGSHVGETLFVL